MKKILGLLILIVLSGCTSKGCNPNDLEICFDTESKHFLMEDDAQVQVAVPNEAYGASLEALWNESYPDRVGLLKAIINSPQSYQEIAESKLDILFVDAHSAILLKDNLLSIDEHLANKIKPHLAPNFIIDETDLFFLPMTAYGVSFATNLDYLRANNLSTEDANQDGLVDAFDTFEEIAQAKLSIPFDFNDSLFTQGFSTLGYPLFESSKDEPFDQLAFLEAMESLAHLGQLFDASGWTYEQFLSNPNQAFSMIGTWMYYEAASSDNLYSKLPSFEEKQFKSMAYPSGYVIKKSTIYPNAVYEVLDLMFSEKGLQLFNDTSDNLLVYNASLEVTESQLIEPYTIEYKNDAQEMMAIALLESQIENYEGLALNLNYRYYDSLKDIEYQTIIGQVFNQEISAADAQTILVQRYSEWIDSFKEEE